VTEKKRGNTEQGENQAEVSRCGNAKALGKVEIMRGKKKIGNLLQLGVHGLIV